MGRGIVDQGLDLLYEEQKTYNYITSQMNCSCMLARCQYRYGRMANQEHAMLGHANQDTDHRTRMLDKWMVANEQSYIYIENLQGY